MNDFYTADEVEALRHNYPVGSKAAMWRPTDSKTTRDNIRYFGEVVAVNKEGVQIEWYDSEANRVFQTACHPGFDKFALISEIEGLVSIDELMDQVALQTW